MSVNSQNLYYAFEVFVVIHVLRLYLFQPRLKINYYPELIPFIDIKSLFIYSDYIRTPKVIYWFYSIRLIFLNIRITIFMSIFENNIKYSVQNVI